MRTETVASLLKSAIPASNHAAVIAALRQDPIVWGSLQDLNFLKRACDALRGHPEFWSPAALGLISLDLPADPVFFRKQPLTPLEKDLRQQVARTFERLTKGELNPFDPSAPNFLSPAWFAGSALPQACLIALALRERHRLLGSWEGLKNELEGLPNFPTFLWKTPVACLVGLIPDPLPFLAELMSGKPDEQGVNDESVSYELISLALHGFLALPLSEDEQLNLARNLFASSITPGLQRTVVSLLAHKKPSLAKAIAVWLTEQPPAHARDYLEDPGMDLLESLIRLAYQAELHRNANQTGQALRCFDQIIRTIRHLQVDYAARWATVASQALSDSGSPALITQADILAFWKNVQPLDPQSEINDSAAAFQTAISQTLIQVGDQAEIQRWRPLLENDGYSGETAIPTPIALAMAKHFLLTGETQLAQRIAQRIYTETIHFPASAEAFSEIETLYGADSNTRLETLLYLPDILNPLNLTSETVAVLEAAQLERPGEADILLRLGQAYLLAEKPSEALQTLEIALLLKPESLAIRRSLAKSLECLGDAASALEHREAVFAAVQQDPEHADAVINDALRLAECALAAKNPARATEVCQHVLQQDVANWKAHVLYGKAQWLEKDFRTAQSSFQVATQLAPDQPEPWLEMAHMFLSLNQTESAIATLQTAAQAAPRSAQIHLALGKVLLAENALTSAETSFRQAYRLAQSNPQQGDAPHREAAFFQAAEGLGETLRRLGHYNDSKEVLESAVSRLEALNPQAQMGLLYHYAQTLLALGEKETAAPVLARILAGRPQSIQPYLDYGRTLLDIGGDPLEAIEALSHVHKAQPDNAEALALLAEAYEAAHRYPEATQAYLQAMETDLFQLKPWQERICFGLGKTALAQGNIDQAIAALQDAAHINPRNPAIQRALAEACWASNLEVDAWNAARAALQIEPSNPEGVAWFADRVIALFERQQPALPSIEPRLSLSEIAPAQPVTYFHPRQLLQEALEAFEGLQPHASLPASLLVRLGRLQALRGETDAAISSLRAAIHAADATLADLRQAGDSLYRLNDIQGAILALEHAQSVAGAAYQETQTGLQKELARAYLANADLEAAKGYLEAALRSAPEEESLYRTLAAIEIVSNHPEQAIHYLNQGLKRCPQPAGQVALHYWMARLKQNQRQYLSALRHVDQALEWLHKTGAAPTAEINEYELCHLAAELSRSLMDSPTATRYLLQLANRESKTDDPLTAPARLMCACSLAELALESDDLSAASASLRYAEAIAAQLKTHPARLYALQARLAQRNHDPSRAAQGFQACLQELQQEEQNSEHKVFKISPVWEPTGAAMLDDILPPSRFLDDLSAIEAALDLRQWQTGYELAQAALRRDGNQPALHLAYARFLTKQKEFSHLCRDLEIIQHQPVLANQGEDPAQAFQQAIQTADQLLWQSIQDFAANSVALGRADPLPGFSEIRRWKTRGNAAFEELSLPEEWQPDPTAAEDVAAYLAASRRFGVNPERLTAVIADQPDAPPVVQMQKALVLRQQEPHKAFEIAKQLAANAGEDPADAAPSLALLAQVAYLIGDTQVALEAIENALSIWADEPRWHALAAKIYLQHYGVELSSPFQQAIRHFENALRLEPDHPAHYLQLAQALAVHAAYEPDSLRQAIQTLEKATQALPNQAELWIELAKYHTQLLSASSLSKAARYIDQALALLHDQPQPERLTQAQLLKAEIALRRNNPQEAYQLATAVHLAQPANADAVLIQVRALEASGKFEEALAELEKASQAVANSKALSLKRARLIGHCRGESEELRELRALTQQYPQDLPIFEALVEALVRAGATDEAIRTAQEALQKTTPETDPARLAGLHHRLGDLLSQVGQLDQAIHHLSLAMKYQPQRVESYLALGNVYQKQRQHKKAQKIFLQAIQTAPHDARPYVQAAISYKEGKDYQKAEDLLRRAAELAPQDVNIRKQLAAVVAINLVQNPGPLHSHPEH